MNYAKGNAFNLTTADPGKPLILGFFSTPDAIELVRAHYLTNKPEYLAGAVQATQFQAGCNPNNMTYTTGLGANPVRNPLSSTRAIPGKMRLKELLPMAIGTRKASPILHSGFTIIS